MNGATDWLISGPRLLVVVIDMKTLLSSYLMLARGRSVSLRPFATHREEAILRVRRNAVANPRLRDIR